jgi:23S rRNA (guanine2445-N2)-methyltransferase / 23S rRNA (guanine2069-N7)-methyltransferase
MNPPYGTRLGRDDALPHLYTEIGELLRRALPDWDAALFTGNKGLAYRLRMRPERSVHLYNGAIECRLLLYKAREDTNAQAAERTAPHADLAQPAGTAASLAGADVSAFANRLRKNLRTVGRWARRTGVDCYRVYDADLPEYALAIDLYRGDELWVHVQEYAPPPTVDRENAARRLRAALTALPEVLHVTEERIFVKVRERQRGVNQYRRLDSTGQTIIVREGACRFLVNLSDYLDTGLFLDERATRAMIRDLSCGKRVLNLFAYTGTATVYAALGGARSSVSVDLSRTYIEWARRNLALNGVDETHHELIQSDCLEWLRAQTKQSHRTEPFDLVFLAPPTFSNSKRMSEILDIQRDHLKLIIDSAKLLHPEGLLLFSTNRRRFKLDVEALAAFRIEEISAATIPMDFARNPRIHKCWKIRRASARAGETLRQHADGA